MRGVYKAGVFLLIVSSLLFVMAAPSAPTALHIENNFSATLDEGSFTVNWTSGGGDGEVNYTVYVFSGATTLYLIATNDSATGYSFSNTTDGLYTFIIEAENATGSIVNSTGNISITVDTTAPAFTLHSPANTTYTTTSVELNVSDDGSGVIWWYSLNGAANSTFTPNSSINATEGLNNITVWVNDTIGNENMTTQFFTVDTTGPSITIVSPTTGSKTGSSQVINITSDGNTTWYNYNGTNTTYTTPVTVSFADGTYTLTVYANDSLGNEASTSVTFTVDTTPASSGGGGSSSSGGPVTYRPTQVELEEGYTRNLYRGWFVVMQLKSGQHTLEVDAVFDNGIAVTVSSTPQSAELSVGEEKKFDLNSDGRYDLSFMLNSKIGNLFSATLKAIDEEVNPSNQETVEEDTNTAEKVSEEKNALPSLKEESSNTFIWWVVITILLLVVGFYFRKPLQKFFKKR